MSHRMIAGVYAIMNVAEKRSYVGSSRQIRTRILNHKNDLRQGRSLSRPMQADFDRLGREGFAFMILEADIPHKELHTREAFWMGVLKSRDHYNIRPAFKRW